MKLLLCLLGVTLAAGLPTEEPNMKLARGSCPPFWFGFNNCCYKYVATPLTWADAELHCLSQGANLVSIHSGQENTFVSTLIKNFDLYQGYTWIGLSDGHKEGAWMWSDGSKFKFPNWCPTEPNNKDKNEDCVHTNFCDIGKSPKWNDEKCINAYASVCKRCFGCS